MEEIKDTRIRIESYEQFIDEYSIYFHDQYVNGNKESKEIMDLKEFADKKCEFINPIQGKLFSSLQ